VAACQHKPKKNGTEGGDPPSPPQLILASVPIADITLLTPPQKCLLLLTPEVGDLVQLGNTASSTHVPINETILLQFSMSMGDPVFLDEFPNLAIWQRL